MSVEIIAQAFWIILPAYIANASAKLVGGGTPIDFKKTYKDGKRILGDGKTWRGLIIGTLIGMIGGFGLSIGAFFINNTEYSFIGITDFFGFPYMIPILFSICFGALSGDIIESFFKRRRGIDRGKDWIPFDQLDFILGVLIFSFVISGLLDIIGLTKVNWFFENIGIWHILFLCIVTPIIHIVSNFIHNDLILGTKDK
jgi:CDP-2,3-bis-(O-geranylgeranyl)-sn-glycerol synthase